MVKTAYIGVGSNIGDRLGNCRKAIKLLASSNGISLVKVSSFYQTSPVGYLEQPDFVNGVVEINTSLTPEKVYAEMVNAEKKLGKNTPFKDGPRIIDLDLLMFGDLISSSEFLTLPHPRMHLRNFVMEPLAEIAPLSIHPVLMKNMVTLKDSLQEKEHVKHINTSTV